MSEQTNVVAKNNHKTIAGAVLGTLLALGVAYEGYKELKAKEPTLTPAIQTQPALMQTPVAQPIVQQQVAQPAPVAQVAAPAAGGVYTADQAAQLAVGSQATVRFTVVSQGQSSSLQFLNAKPFVRGATTPGQFTIVVPKSSGMLQALTGKMVQVSGTISEYRGTKQIRVDATGVSIVQ